MFSNVCGPSASEVQETNLYHAVQHIGLAMLLVEKGVITFEELEKAKMQATHIVDQEMSERREQMLAESDKDDPGFRSLYERIRDKQV